MGYNLSLVILLLGKVEISTFPGFINDIWWSMEPIEPPIQIQTLAGENCPSDMQTVEGEMLNDGGQGSWLSTSIESLQKTTCTSWIEKKYPERCASFDRDKWQNISKQFPRKSMSFCIDKYEWPNKLGAYPWVMITWPEAHELCWSVGKRMCTEEEWTFACEGEEATPYPYGYNRNSNECNLDNRWRQYSSKILIKRGSKECSNELKRLWQGKRSGDMPQCASSFGVEDMNGSVDEWTIGTIKSQYPYRSVLKGGYWGPVRTRCRPATRNHGPGHTFYQQGFRCCKDLIKHDK
jgi:sulfatase modifying factor 1